MRHRILFLLGSLIALACGGASAAPKNPFFAMDTALRDGKVKSADDGRMAAVRRATGFNDDA